MGQLSQTTFQVQQILNKADDAISVSAGTVNITADAFYGDGSHLTGINAGGSYLPLSGGTLTGPLTGTTFYGDGSNLTGVVSTHNGLSGLQGGQSGQYYHLTQAEYAQVSGTSIFETKTNFNSHSADTSIHFTKSSINLSDLSNTAHTHTIANVTNLQSSLDSKLNLTGGTISGSLSANTISAVNYSGITTSNVLNVSSLSGNTITDIFNSADATEVMSLVSGDMIALARMNGDTSENKMIDVDDAKSYFQTDLSPFYSHSADTSIHFTKNSINFSDLGSTAHTHTVSEITDFSLNRNVFNVTTYQQIQDILNGGTSEDSVVINLMNDISFGSALQILPKNVIFRGNKFFLGTFLSEISGLQAGTYNITFENLFDIGGYEAVFLLGNSFFATTINLKFKNIISLGYNLSAYNLAFMKGSGGTIATVRYNSIANISINTTTNIVPVQENYFYKNPYQFDIQRNDTFDVIYFKCDLEGNFNLRCSYMVGNQINRTIVLIPPLPLKLCIRDLFMVGTKFENPTLYTHGTDTINKFRYDNEPLAISSNLTGLDDKIEYRNNLGVGTPLYTSSEGVVDISTTGLTLVLNYTGPDVTCKYMKQLVITGTATRNW